MADYTTTKVKVMIHDAAPGTETGDVGTLARDIKDYIESTDSTNQEVLGITHCHLGGGRVLTVITGGT
tara:strand:+ start:69 stop:272 length:204 start_codon:yes stop_codon:yes gene_type:complete